MSEPGPLLSLTRLDGGKVQIHADRIVKIIAADPAPSTDSGPNPECGSTLTLATLTGTSSIGVAEYLLHRGVAELAGFLLVTDLHGLPIKINPAYVILVRSHEPSGTVIEIPSSTGTEEIYVQESLDAVSDWWAEVARSTLMDPGVHW